LQQQKPTGKPAHRDTQSADSTRFNTDTERPYKFIYREDLEEFKSLKINMILLLVNIGLCEAWSAGGDGVQLNVVGQSIYVELEGDYVYTLQYICGTGG
jgi:hypothetical protein